MRNIKMFMTVALLLGSAGVSYAATGTYLEPRGAHYIQVADLRDVVRDESTGTIVRSSSGECVRTKWLNDYDACSTTLAAAPPPMMQQRRITLTREQRTVYFGFNQASLSPEMKERLNSLAANLRSDKQVRGARIVGYADRIGNPQYNERLSKKRAETVRRYLMAQGIINARVTNTRWVGSSKPETDCPNSLSRPQLINCLQKDRRVEVEIDYAPEEQASR